MKHLFINIFFLIIIMNQSNAQSHFEILSDSAHENTKMLRGIITKSDIDHDPLFSWYAESQRIYSAPDTAAVNAFEKNKDKIYFIIFGGTWCEDTHFILPKFYKIQEASGFPEDRITVFAVDRNKHALGSVAEAFHITNTPTIIVMKNGKESGRLVEYGKSGKWDKELAGIINK